MYKYIFSNLDPTVFNSEVQICRYEGLDQVQMDQGIDQTEWGQWDIQTLVEKDAIVSHVNVNIFLLLILILKPHLFILMILNPLLAMILHQT